MIMATLYGSDYYGNSRALQEAKRQVRAKFPQLPEGSSGWYRAVENRRKRLLSTGT